MKHTHIGLLVGVGLFVACASAILTWGFYGELLSPSPGASLMLWILAALCLYLGAKMKDQKERGAIGMDRSQLSPLQAAQYLVIAKASAWTGALVGGAYIGMATYVLPRYSQLVAAAEDTPGVIASALGGIALSAAGIYLERHCETPPPTDAEPA